VLGVDPQEPVASTQVLPSLGNSLPLSGANVVCVRRACRPPLDLAQLRGAYALAVAAKCLAQLAGSSSSILLAGCVATLTSTSAR
jgi:hypothetical protein